MLQAPGHAHQAGHIEGHESEMETDEPAPECRLAPALIQLEAECLGKPVIVASDRPEEDARDDNVMEMGDQENTVVDLPIDRRQRQQHAGQTAEHERHHEADCPQHRHREPDPTAVHR